MKYSELVAAFCFVCMFEMMVAPNADGHGIPLHVEVESGMEMLVASHVGNDFPSSIVGQVGADNMTFATIMPPSLGEITLWELPGLEIFGMGPPR
jgi:hypothetical protein